MGRIPDLRQLYQPVQPAGLPGKGVLYREYLPHPRLQEIIYCYWELKSSQPLAESHSYRVVADGCIDIFLELGQPDRSFVMGFSDRFTQFPLDISFHYVGIRFLPGMFSRLSGIDAGEISGRLLSLDEILPRSSRFLSGLTPERGAPPVQELLDRHFLSLSPMRREDERVFRALALILDGQGNLQLEKDLDCGLSPRQLRRLFRYYMGSSPKRFSQVVRFQFALKQAGTSPEGYYDQAHFIKEFRQFYGLTPGQAAADRAGT